MFEMVAVGAIAMQFELRMPYCFIASLTGVQSWRCVLATSIFWPLASSRSDSVSKGSSPLSHFEPAKDAYAPRSLASSAELRMRSEERRVGKEGRSRWSPYH